MRTAMLILWVGMYGSQENHPYLAMTSQIVPAENCKTMLRDWCKIVENAKMGGQGICLYSYKAEDVKGLF